MAAQELKARYEGARDAAEAQRVASRAAEGMAHSQVVEADTAEEKFKTRVETLRQHIEDYNARIRQMSSGFGFFSKAPSSARAPEPEPG